MSGLEIGYLLNDCQISRATSVKYRQLNPAAFVLVGVVLLGIAAAASCIPALRAMRVDPIEALRED